MLTWIVIARAVHVLAGVAWAGAVFALVLVVQPLGARHAAEGALRWTGLIGGRALVLIAISAALTVVSGGWLFAAVHGSDDSAGARMLIGGALLSLLALVLGFGVSRPASKAAARLAAQASGAETQRRIATLRRRAAWSLRGAALLLALTAAAMASFRYAAAFSA